jgi:hypothetical protein
MSFVKESSDRAIKREELLHSRFVRGLKEDYGLTDEEIEDIEQNWVYCGYRHMEDEWDDGAKQFRYYFPTEPCPEFSKECVCRQKLNVRNDWITDGKEVLVIGQCCKNMFIVNRLKTCQTCKKSHRNRTNNYCNDCREEMKRRLKECICGRKKKENDEYCDKCYIESQTCKCGKRKREGYKQCYSCYTINKQSKPHTTTNTDRRIITINMNALINTLKRNRT